MLLPAPVLRPAGAEQQCNLVAVFLCFWCNIVPGDGAVRLRGPFNEGVRCVEVSARVGAATRETAALDPSQTSVRTCSDVNIEWPAHLAEAGRCELSARSMALGDIFGGR